MKKPLTRARRFSRGFVAGFSSGAEQVCEGRLYARANRLSNLAQEGSGLSTSAAVEVSTTPGRSSLIAHPGPSPARPRPRPAPRRPYGEYGLGLSPQMLRRHPGWDRLESLNAYGDDDCGRVNKLP